MPLHHVTGNLLDSPCQALVNAVNCVGVAGAGLAKQFQDRWPDQVGEYRAFCGAGMMKPGVVHVALLPDGRSILSVPTKRHWRDKSLLSDVAAGINTMAQHCKAAGVSSIAIPPLGCGLGGLPKGAVLKLLSERMTELPREVHLYNFG